MATSPHSCLPPTLAVGADAVWVRSYKGTIPLAIRVDARTNEVARERIPYFSPIAATADGVWFMDGELSRLNPRTCEVERSIELGAVFGKGLAPGDAAYDSRDPQPLVAALAVRRGKQSEAWALSLRPTRVRRPRG